jgi:hypothetical protein
MVELTMTIGLENLYSRSNHALGIGGEGFSEGMYCVRPSGLWRRAILRRSAARASLSVNGGALNSQGLGCGS